MTEEFGVGYGSGLVSFENLPDCIIGEIMPEIELMGLPEKQENSLKNIIKKIVRKETGNSIYISPEEHTKIRTEYYKRIDSLPVPGGCPAHD